MRQRQGGVGFHAGEGEVGADIADHRQDKELFRQQPLVGLQVRHHDLGDEIGRAGDHVAGHHLWYGGKRLVQRLRIVAGMLLDLDLDEDREPQPQPRRIHRPVGALTTADVRAEAARLGLRTATKPDSQDVCFITTTGGRHGFVGDKIPLTPGRVVDGGGREVGRVDAVELITLGQRKGLGLAGGGAPRFAVSVDVPSATVVVGGSEDLRTPVQRVEQVSWADGPVEGEVLVQCRAHGEPRPATAVLADTTTVDVRWHEPQPRVAPGQSVVLYRHDEVEAGGLAA